jgi:hypothetical protein
MNTIWTVVIVVIAVVVVLAAGYAIWTAQRRSRLRSRFGPEYDRLVQERGNRRDAERELTEREQRVHHMDIRPLDPAARDTYRQEWSAVQERFVDTPEDALADADRLVRQVMSDRGYEAGGYEERVATLSVEHGRTLEHYRNAHDISNRAAAKEASTEELRQAMVHYRALFEDLLDGHGNGGTSRTSETRTEETAESRPATDPDAGAETADESEHAEPVAAPWTQAAKDQRRTPDVPESERGEGPR